MDATQITNKLRGAGRQALVIGAIGLAVAGFGLVVDHRQFFIGYLEAYLLVLGLTLGSLAFLMINNLVGGNWGVFLRPLLEAAANLIPLMAVLFVPIIFGMKDLYIWTHPEVVQHDHLLQAKSGYLNQPAFITRTVVFFLIWMAIRFAVKKNPLLTDNLREKRRLQRRSAIGLLLYGVTISIAAVDWVMSIQPKFFSNMYGLIFGVGELLTMIAFMNIAVIFIRHYWMRQNYPGQSLHDTGNLLLMLVLFWTYISFAQFLIVWSGKLPGEWVYFHMRSINGWAVASFGLLALHWALPFALLLNRPLKRNPNALWKIAALVLTMRIVDMVWSIGPNYYDSLWHLQWIYIAAIFGLFGVWLWAFLSNIHAPALFLMPAADAHGHASHAHAHEGPQDRPHGDRR